jgi:para-nitrobenzyl esterase
LAVIRRDADRRAGGAANASIHHQETRMRPFRNVLPGALAIALCACAATDTGAPVLPGYVNAPPPPMAAAGDSLLTNTVWTWQGTQFKNGARVVPDAPERYTLVFQPGGMVNVRADCNRGSASYLLNGSALSFGPIALTKMMCPPGSRDTEFLKDLSTLAGQQWSGNDLVLTLTGDAGTMRFTTTRQ